MKRLRVAVFVAVAGLMTDGIRTAAQTPPPISVLIDVVGAGGAWWLPQSPPFDPALPHQGKPLFEFLRTSGYAVTLHAEGPVTAALLAGHDVAITLSYAPASETELAAWRDYVAGGGRLILLSDISGQRALPQRFGLHVGSTVVHGPVTDIAPHPITRGVQSVGYFGGNTYTGWPDSATILATLAGEPVMGVMPFGLGLVFFMADVNGFQILPNVQNWPRPLLDNVLDFLVRRRPPLVVPSAAWLVEGNDRNRIPFFSTDLFGAPDVGCWEQVYHASEFPFDGPRDITEIAFRLDGSQTPVEIVLGDVEFRLGTTTREPDGLAHVNFCTTTNADPPGTIVARDRLAFHADGDLNPLGGALTNFPFLNARAFEAVVPISGFRYDPGDGNLVLRVTTAGGDLERFQGSDLLNTFLDAVRFVGDVVSTVWVLEPFIATSTASTSGLVTRFTFGETRSGGPPVARAGEDQPGAACTVQGGAVLTLDGSASFDPDGGMLAFTWTGPFPEGGGTVSGVRPSVTLPVGGPHTVTLMVQDASGNADSDTVAITVRDTEAPLLTLALDAVAVPPTTHGGAELDVVAAAGARAVDVCDPDPVLTHDAPAVFPIGWNTVVTFTARDAAGNHASQAFSVRIVTPAESAAALSTEVLALMLPRPAEQPLTATLRTAVRLLEDGRPGNDVAAARVLEAFIGLVGVMEGRHLRVDQAAHLVARARDIVEALATLPVPRP